MLSHSPSFRERGDAEIREEGKGKEEEVSDYAMSRFSSSPSLFLQEESDIHGD